MKTLPVWILFVCLISPSVRSFADEGVGHHHPKGERLKVLSFSGTGWYRHPETAAINRWLVLLGDKKGFDVDVSEDGKDLRPKQISRYQVIILNNANELVTILSEDERKSVEDWYAGGKGIVALHAALVHQQDWKWLSDLGGCDFDSDSEYLKAKVVVDPAAKEHPAVQGHGRVLLVHRGLDQPYANGDRSSRFSCLAAGRRDYLRPCTRLLQET